MRTELVGLARDLVEREVEEEEERSFSRKSCSNLRDTNSAGPPRLNRMTGIVLSVEERDKRELERVLTKSSPAVSVIWGL